MTFRCSLCKHLQRTFERERDVWQHIRDKHQKRLAEARPVKASDEEEKAA